MNPRRIGILFYFQSAGEVWILLGERRRSLAWDLPDGENPETDKNPWLVATDICRDTLGGMPTAFESRFSITAPIGLLSPFRTAFVVELPECPEFGTFWTLDHHEGTSGFRRFGWHRLHSLPRRIHWTLVPVLWRLWLMGPSRKIPRRMPKPQWPQNRRSMTRTIRSKIRRVPNRLFDRV